MHRGERRPQPPVRRTRAGWEPADDAEQYAMAAKLNTHLRLWWVYWSPAGRCYWALYQGPERVEPIKARTAEGLYEQACAEQRRVQAPPNLLLRAEPAPPAPWDAP